MVTKEQLMQLRANRAVPHSKLEYNMDGASHIVSSLEMDREREIKLGELAMKDALLHMRQEYALSRHDGLARVHFNHTTTEIKP